MVRADFFIFGYRHIYIDRSDLPSATSLFLQKGIRVSISHNGVVFARERDICKIQDILSGRIEFSYSEPKGIYGVWTRSKHKVSTIICLLISVVVLFLSQSIIWDIRPIGNEKIANSEIRHRLECCGFSIGDLWNKTELSQIENEFLRNYEDVSWININRRGSVAYVSLMEKSLENDEVDKKILYSNIIAAYDCVIEEVTVKSGTAIVKAGDIVKKGDLLILGASGNGDFCRAEGQVVGRVSDSMTVSVDRKYEKKRITSRKIQSININIFKKSINIFKTYGNLTEEYDIIDDEKEYSLPNGALLPFSITLSYIPSYETESGLYGDEELVSITKDRLSLETALMLSKSDLVKMSTDGEFTDDGYKMWSDIVYLTDVGRENAFEITD